MTKPKQALNRVFVTVAGPSRLAQAVGDLEADAEAAERIIVADGEAGRGKTSAAIWLAAAKPEQRTYIRALQLWGGGLPMLKALGLELGRRAMPSTADRCFAEIRNLILARDAATDGKTTLVIDEANYLRQNTLSILRDLHDLTGINLVLLGESRIVEELQRHQRLWSRVTARVPFTALTDSEAQAAASALLPEGATIQPEAVKVLLTGAAGLFRDFVVLLRDALRIALTNDQTEITPQATQVAVKRRRAVR